MATVGKAKAFLEECVGEMEKVTWPDRDQLRNATWVVILFTMAVSGIIWIMDLASRAVIVDLVMGIFRS